MTQGGARVPHIIRPNKSGAGPQKWVVVDTETLPVQLGKRQWQHVFRLGVCAYWRRSDVTHTDSVELRRYTQSDDLVKELAAYPKSKERVGVVAHNLDYDTQVLDTNAKLRAEGYTLTRAILERGKWVQRWTKGSRVNGSGARTLQLIDLGNFFPIPLHELASWLGMRKWKMPDFEADEETWFRYCENDVRIELAALQAWLAFCDENDLGYFAPTIAGQAFNAFRHRFMQDQIYVHVHPDVIGIERASYYGGRCETWWRGKAPQRQYVHVDCNSMYGSVMLNNQFPVRQVGHYRAMPVSKLESLLTRLAAIALVTISTDVPAFPVRIESKVCFPVGTFDTVLASPELALAIEYGYISAVHEVITYETAPVFRDYVTHFWNLRARAVRRGDDFTAKVSKRFLTALHGKFGQRIWTSKLVAEGVDREDEIIKGWNYQSGEYFEQRILAGRVEERIHEISGRDTLVAIPSHVASYARVKLWRLIVEAGFENVLYCDTDSLIMRREGLPRIRHSIKPKQLGGVRIINQSNLLYIRAPKWYRFGREVKRRGLSRNARMIEWDKFEQNYYRTTTWALSHHHAHSAIVEEVEIKAPYHRLLQEHGLGHALPWRTTEEYAK